MATFDLPPELYPQVASFGLEKAGLQFRSPFNGATQAVDFVAERWKVSMTTVPVMSTATGPLEVPVNQMAGGIHRLRLGHPTRRVPRGSLRGTPLLQVDALRGNQSLTLTDCRSANNLLLHRRWEATNCTIEYGNAGAMALHRGDEGDQYAFQWVSVPDAPGGTYTFSLSLRSNAPTVPLILRLRDGADTEVAAVPFEPLSTWQRISLTASLAPEAAPNLRVYLHWPDQVGDAALPGDVLELKDLQLERGAVLTPPLGYPTLQAGDMLGDVAGTHLFQVAADARMNDDGALVVPLVNRVRSTLPAGTAMVWNNPRVSFIAPAMMNTVVHRPGYAEGVALDLEEVWG